jgi:kanamycin kinase
MDEPDFSHLAEQHRLGDDPVPEVVQALAGPHEPVLVWRNDLGGLTFRVGDRYVKWNPRRTGVDLDRERVRLRWLAGRHPVPPVVGHGEDGEAQWLVTAGLPGEPAAGDRWRARRPEAIAAIAAGLRAIHAVPLGDVPAWAAESWVARTPSSLGPRPPVDEPVVVHGDACAPNTLIGDDGRFVGHVDLGDLAVGDRWADLAVASLSLDWNFGEGHQDELFEAYGVAPDEARIRYYRALWEQES